MRDAESPDTGIFFTLPGRQMAEVHDVEGVVQLLDEVAMEDVPASRRVVLGDEHLLAGASVAEVHAVIGHIAYCSTGSHQSPKV